MLYIVLLLVLVAFGLLVTALTTTMTWWAWGSVALSGVAGVVLVLDWLRRRRAKRTAELVAARAASTSGANSEADLEVDIDLHAALPVELRDGLDGTETSADDDQGGTFAAASPRAGESAVTVPPGVGVPEAVVRESADDVEPAEEETDAVDLLVVADLSDPVRVVDERPRYHLAACGWLRSRPTLALPVNEARELGFTPCGLCGPDAALSARHRAARPR